ncbi:hypothetical protein GUJ93_ZPchr0005g16052 [Zizania palustris]|uniref:Uncharacterized protein n=1 Tax=Zizania palustris TaxID=103762 RepID=A0A8J5SXX9_ZIZPA|nr:hypothetical protein GUJ93_ZPchr0005g16052 [Zizania palustris]
MAPTEALHTSSLQLLPLRHSPADPWSHVCSHLNAAKFLNAVTDPNFCDSDGRTALHIASCEGQAEVVTLLLGRGAEAVADDRWGSTPLADAMHYQNYDVIKILEKRRSKLKGS